MGHQPQRGRSETDRAAIGASSATLASRTLAHETSAHGLRQLACRRPAFGAPAQSTVSRVAGERCGHGGHSGGSTPEGACPTIAFRDERPLTVGASSNERRV
jgi:hypothetical protein